jgi:hypothetical protein
MAKDKIIGVKIEVELESGKTLTVIPEDLAVETLSYNMEYDVRETFDGYGCTPKHTGEVRFSLNLKGWKKP